MQENNPVVIINNTYITTIIKTTCVSFTQRIVYKILLS